MKPTDAQNSVTTNAQNSVPTNAQNRDLKFCFLTRMINQIDQEQNDKKMINDIFNENTF